MLFFFRPARIAPMVRPSPGGDFINYQHRKASLINLLNILSVASWNCHFTIHFFQSLSFDNLYFNSVTEPFTCLLTLFLFLLSIGKSPAMNVVEQWNKKTTKTNTEDGDKAFFLLIRRLHETRLADVTACIVRLNTVTDYPLKKNGVNADIIVV